MKVKNVVFSGFAAALFAGVCGAANAAVELTSKTYVDNALAGKADLIDLEALETTVGQKATIESLQSVALQVNTNTTDIKTLKETTLPALQGALEKAIADGDAEATEAITALQEAVQGLQGSTATNETMLALSNRVKAIEDAPYAAKSYVDDAINAVNAALADYAKSADVTAALALKADTSALTAAVEALEAAIEGKVSTADMTAVNQAIATANEAITALQTGKADATDVTALQNAIAALGDTYATDTELKDEIDAVKALISAIDLTPYAKTADVNAALEQVSAKLDDKANISDVNTELAKKANVDDVYTKGQVDQKVADVVAGDMSEALEAYVKTETYNTDMALKADKTTVADDIAAALQSAKDYADAQDADTVYDDTALAARVTANEGNISTNTAAIESLQGTTGSLKAMAFVDTVATGNIDNEAVTTAKIAGQVPAEGEMLLMSTGSDGKATWTPVKVY